MEIQNLKIKNNKVQCFYFQKRHKSDQIFEFETKWHVQNNHHKLYLMFMIADIFSFFFLCVFLFFRQGGKKRVEKGTHKRIRNDENVEGDPGKGKKFDDK